MLIKKCLICYCVEGAGEIRRKQTRPGNLLLGFISIVSSDNHDNVKADVWHKALSLMLERKCIIIRHDIEDMMLICFSDKRLCSHERNASTVCES